MLSAEGPQTTFLKHLTVAARARLVKLGLEVGRGGAQAAAGPWGRPWKEASHQCEFLGPMGDTVDSRSLSLVLCSVFFLL